MTLAGALVAGAAVSEPRPSVLELYTSEGCSSCPPAEEFVAELAQRRDVLPLSFHVDYWNDLGWRDRFTAEEATPRQRVYAGTLRRNSVYTPQAVIDGEADYVGSDRRSILAALSRAREGVATRLAIADANLTVTVGALPGGTPADVLLISYLYQATSQIGRGENSGRTLQEFNIVRSVVRLGSWDGSERSFHAPLASLPRDATHVALIVQAAGQRAILGAASLAIR